VEIGSYANNHFSGESIILRQNFEEYITYSLINEVYLKATDTTALSIGSTLFFLALNPECQMKALAEVDSLLTEGGKTELSMEDLGNLNYLEMCWKEAMRLHSPIAIIGRKLSQAVHLGKLITTHNYCN
jgi:hypothetical protein